MIARVAQRAGIAVIALVALTNCGAEPDRQSAARDTSSTQAAPKSTTAQRITTPPPATRSPEEEARFVASVTAGTFAQSGEVLSAELVKSNPLIEAQVEFRFDESARTVVLAVTSVFDTGSPDVAYRLATDFAPIFWGPQATASVRPESLVLFSVTVDDSSYQCDGPTMAALADRELSTEMFVQQCGS